MHISGAGIPRSVRVLVTSWGPRHPRHPPFDSTTTPGDIQAAEI